MPLQQANDFFTRFGKLHNECCGRKVRNKNDETPKLDQSVPRRHTKFARHTIHLDERFTRAHIVAAARLQRRVQRIKDAQMLKPFRTGMTKANCRRGEIVDVLELTEPSDDSTIRPEGVKRTV